jgi:hypothetical protein
VSAEAAATPPSRGGIDAAAIAQIQARADAFTEQRARTVADDLATTTEIDALNAAAQRIERTTMRRSIFWFALAAVVTVFTATGSRVRPPSSRRRRRARNSV